MNNFKESFVKMIKPGEGGWKYPDHYGKDNKLLMRFRPLATAYSFEFQDNRFNSDDKPCVGFMMDGLNYAWKFWVRDDMLISCLYSWGMGDNESKIDSGVYIPSQLIKLFGEDCLKQMYEDKMCCHLHTIEWLGCEPTTYSGSLSECKKHFDGVVEAEFGYGNMLFNFNTTFKSWFFKRYVKEDCPILHDVSEYSPMVVIDLPIINGGMQKSKSKRDEIMVTYIVTKIDYWGWLFGEIYDINTKTEYVGDGEEIPKSVVLHYTITK